VLKVTRKTLDQGGYLWIFIVNIGD